MKKVKELFEQIKLNNKIKFYQSVNKNVPVMEYINSLVKDRSRRKELEDLLETIFRVGTYSTYKTMPHSRHMGNDILEIRSNRNRIIYCYIDDGYLLLLHGFYKDTQQTPKSELDLAIKIKNDYLRRK